MTKEFSEWVLKPSIFERVSNEVEAVKFTYDNMVLVSKWCGGKIEKDHQAYYLLIPYLFEPLKATIGDWIVKDDRGRFDVMSEKELKESYIFKPKMKREIAHDE